jgi:uncharacterized damage-inducible protein DinB
VVHRTLDGIGDDALTGRVDPQANTVAWLVWHIGRIQDDHVAGVSGQEQTWTRDGWAERFGLPFDRGAIGYGQSPEEVAQVRVSADLLLGYLDAVHERTRAFVATVTDEDLERVVDEGWDPPVTLAVRLVSVISDNLQHAGQAAYARGVLERRVSRPR